MTGPRAWRVGWPDGFGLRLGLVLSLALLPVGAMGVVQSGPDGLGRGIGQHLLRGFARKLGGQVQRDFAGGLCRVCVRFGLDSAEAALATA